MKYSILLSIVDRRNLLLKLTSKKKVVLEDALFFLLSFLACYKHIIPYLKPLGPDEFGNTLLIRFFKDSETIYYVTLPVGARAAPCINILKFLQQITLYVIIPTRRLIDYKQSQITSLGQAVLPNKSPKNSGFSVLRFWNSR